MTGGSDEPRFLSSSFSGGGNCIEVARLADGRIALRDSEARSVVVVVAEADWKAFLDGVKDHEFDQL